MLTRLKYIYVNQTMINNMKRKFNHEQLAMVGGLVAIIGSVVFNLITQSNLWN